MCNLIQGEDDSSEADDQPLISHLDVDDGSMENSVTRTRLRLLFTKGSAFLVGILVLIAGAVLAGLFPHGGKLGRDCIINNTCYCSG